VAVWFHNEDIQYNLPQKTRHKNWLKHCISGYNKKPGTINFIFAGNALLRRMNRKHLNHNRSTDVLTFDYTESCIISGDIFISIEKVKENAGCYKVTFEDELRRVMIHGVLHLMGFNDAMTKEREKMREMENEALNLWLKVV
jgi:probable rRNA maturation factor